MNNRCHKCGHPFDACACLNMLYECDTIEHDDND